MGTMIQRQGTFAKRDAASTLANTNGWLPYVRSYMLYHTYGSTMVHVRTVGCHTYMYGTACVYEYNKYTAENAAAAPSLQPVPLKAVRQQTHPCTCRSSRCSTSVPTRSTMVRTWHVRTRQKTRQMTQAWNQQQHVTGIRNNLSHVPVAPAALHTRCHACHSKATHTTPCHVAVFPQEGRQANHWRAAQLTDASAAWRCSAPRSWESSEAVMVRK
jgi:hypothetical protein